MVIVTFCRQRNTVSGHYLDTDRTVIIERINASSDTPEEKLKKVTHVHKVADARTLVGDIVAVRQSGWFQAAQAKNPTMMQLQIFGYTEIAGVPILPGLAETLVDANNSLLRTSRYWLQGAPGTGGTFVSRAAASIRIRDNLDDTIYTLAELQAAALAAAISRFS